MLLSEGGTVSSISIDVLGLCSEAQSVLLETVTPPYICLLFCCAKQEGRTQGIPLRNQALMSVKGRLG